MKTNKIIAIVLLIAFGYTSYIYTEEQKKKETYYFINEDNESDTTICKVNNNNDCLTKDDYILLKYDRKVYGGLSKNSDKEFRIITNEEYYSLEWINYKMPNENNARILMALMALELILLVIYVYELLFKQDTVVEKYGTEQ